MAISAWDLTPSLTPATRTPWGGTRIGEELAPHLDLPSGTRVGEAWSVSMDRGFPSTLDSGDTLATALDNAGVPPTTLLLKLLDAASSLSVQIHPDDAYAGLGEAQGGKPESWFILARDPGAGLYLGFREGVDEAAVRGVLSRDGDLSELMNFVPVEPGDFFLIEAGTPHAIGGGVSLLEPQRVLPGRAGMTYRYWDWGRRYDETGTQVDAPAGALRELHVEDALAVTRWDAVTAPDFVASIRRRPSAGSGPLSVSVLSGATEVRGAFSASGSPLASDTLRVAQLEGSGRARFESDTFAALFVQRGQVRVGDLDAAAGHTLALPAPGEWSLELVDAEAVVCSAAPEGGWPDPATSVFTIV